MMLWPSTHHDVRTDPVSSDDVWKATTDYAPLIKNADSTAYVLGYTAWLVFNQTLFTCGQPINGFQPKALSYPLFYFALAFAMRGQVIRAGLAAGLATVFHVIVGGWGCLAVFAAMQRNAQSATEFFRIPPNRVIELGGQVEI